MYLIRKLISCFIIRVSTDSSIPQMNYTSFGSKCIGNLLVVLFLFQIFSILLIALISLFVDSVLSSGDLVWSAAALASLLKGSAISRSSAFLPSDLYLFLLSSAHHTPLLSLLLLFLLYTKLLENIIQMLIYYKFKFNTFILS